jgi:hypothetical protein
MHVVGSEPARSTVVAEVHASWAAPITPGGMYVTTLVRSIRGRLFTLRKGR